ncbi:MAG: penicillin acylase family protein [bacterium]|nr:penicillin acylase family protein [bacterium]
MKKLKKILLVTLIIFVTALMGIYIYLRMTIPKSEGTLQVKGISNEIQVKRNQWGVPLIEAGTLEDMYFAIGFCHASDRLFQMDLARRLTSGKLSEIFGARALKSDKYHKGLLVEEAVEKKMAGITPENKKVLQAYSRGINAFIETQKLPPEFALLRYKPEPWSSKDSIFIFKRMEMVLSGSGGELYNYSMIKALGKENAKILFSGDWGTSIINKEEYDSFYTNKSLQAALLNERELMENGVGSNNWVISGNRTTTGAPILANDPHLSNIFPSYFYQLSARAGDMEFSGHTFPGVPYIIIGRTNHVGWTITNIATDVIDYFILEINPDNKNQYKWDGEWLDFDIVEKQIKVKGGKDVIHKVKNSRLGVVLEEDGEYLARHSLDLYPSTVAEATFRMNLATNAEQFLDALKLFTSPASNIVFADSLGNIGYFPTGAIPKRKKGTGDHPLPATGSSDGWDGLYDENEKPYLFNPAKGYIVTANNPVLPSECLPIYTKYSSPTFRADRIDELVRAKPKLSVADNQNIQTDSFLKSAQFLTTKIKDFSFDSKGATFILDSFKKWNFKADTGLAPYLFFRFQHYLTQNIFDDHIKEEKQKYLISSNWLYKILNYPKPDSEVAGFSFWVDNTHTPGKEDFKTVVGKSLDDTYKEYMEESKEAAPEWRKLHTVTYKHPLGGIPVLGSFLNKGPFPMAGGKGTVLSASFRRNVNFHVTHLSAFRMIMDFSDFSNSMLINSSGQSGHFMSDNYDDQIDNYVNSKYRKMEDFNGKLKVLKLIPHK